MHTGSLIDHGGIVIFSFVDAEGKVVYRNRLVARVGAATAYRALRVKYPEWSEHTLNVSVLRDHEVHSRDRRLVAAKGSHHGPIKVEGGFVRELSSRLPEPPRIGVAGAQASAATNLSEEVAAKLREAVGILTGIDRGERAEAVTRWDPT